MRTTPVAAVSVLLVGRFHDTVLRSLLTVTSRTLAAAISISRHRNQEPAIQSEKGSRTEFSLQEVQVSGRAGMTEQHCHAFRMGMNSSVMARFCVVSAKPRRILRIADRMLRRTRTDTGKPVCQMSGSGLIEVICCTAIFRCLE